ncbi:hypothetical protein Goarm_003201 [Gossypium armourianum]|uniref:Uncharacterized protein n=1 Tax=Gossypium armourianum TaxID=34283 RepID=A0A7J9K2W6_9ROSI|nr:hypothetical protein [Gossypium armourianum]
MMESGEISVEEVVRLREASGNIESEGFSEWLGWYSKLDLCVYIVKNAYACINTTFADWIDTADPDKEKEKEIENGEVESYKQSPAIIEIDSQPSIKFCFRFYPLH